jgi:hypothetical protein
MLIMKKLVLLALFGLMSLVSFGQSIKDYQKKTTENSKERTLLLDILRASVYEEVNTELVFVVNHFKTDGKYAWFKGDAQRKDGKQLRLDDDKDCCHVECLFVKKQGKWYIAASGAFSTDVWYADIQERFPQASDEIFEE